MSETIDVTKASQESLKYTIAQLGYSGLKVNNITTQIILI